ncbi:unnamed protein product [Diatraea saccharalis]|uniref:Uncharacterized protein n=1 Tax=Diatraea saccharalis TaxID=40085 RepID=A0A9N9WII7_9NEOP|nr:unnamed protein product [Diatraea saccharalis]
MPGGVPQSGDSAYGFCDTDTNAAPQAYDDRFPNMRQNPQFPQTQNFAQAQNFAQSQNFAQGQSFGQSYSSQIAQGNFQEGFGEASGSFDTQTGVWGPPPPYSPQGRSGSRHHLHQDPAAATLLHHHHIDVHRNSMHDHNIQSHTCRNSYMQQNVQESTRLNPELTRINPDMSRLNPDLVRLNPELARMNPELARLNPELARLNPDLARLNPELARMNSDLQHLQMYPTDVNELARMQAEMHIAPDARFNTLRGHLVPYRSCQRTLGMSAGNLHRDCRMEEGVVIECLHSKTASKVSDQSSDSSQKQGKENLGFQNDKHSPMRSSMQDCHRGVNQNAESEVYFADVSSCCNVSVKADCCMNPNVSALVGTIENHPESTSESDTGSFTLTRQQRPQPQVGSKRRPRQNEKLVKNQEKTRQDLNSSLRLTEQQIEHLNNSMRMCERMNDARIERMNETRSSERMDRIESRDRLNDSRLDRVNDTRMSDRMNDTRSSERTNNSREARKNDPLSNDSRMMNESRVSDSRMNDSRLSESRMNDSRLSESRMNDSRLSESRMNDSRLSDCRNERFERLNDSRTERMNDSRMVTERIDRMNDTRIEDRRMSDLNSSIRIEGSPKIRSHMSPLRIQKNPKNLPKEHCRQSSSDSGKPEFFVPPPPNLSPLSPNTDESLLSDEDRPDTVYSNEPETSKCLGPDSQYEPVREEKEDILKTNHHHCYSDTNTMDSGWQSGSEKQVTD